MCSKSLMSQQNLHHLLSRKPIAIALSMTKEGCQLFSDIGVITFESLQCDIVTLPYKYTAYMQKGF